MQNNPAQITEADVTAYLLSEAKRLSALFGGAYSMIKAEATKPMYDEPSIRFTAYVDDGNHLEADTLAGAIERQVKEYRGEKAKALRHKAAALLREAEALESQA